jgi:hypothetical protein
MVDFHVGYFDQFISKTVKLCVSYVLEQICEDDKLSTVKRRQTFSQIFF